MAQHRSARQISLADAARALPVLIAAIALIWLSNAVTSARIRAVKAPDVAMAMWGADADARARQAAQMLAVRGRRPDLAGARALAEAALLREPVNVTAARVLGLIASVQRQDARAERLMAYAESLSRRDLLTQLWLIESNVAKNDIPGALRHYDRALRTSTESYDLLIPVLVNASAEPAVGDRVATLVASRPPWWTAFTQRMVESGTDVRSMRLVLARLNLDTRNQGERELLGFALNKLVQLRDHAGAFALYARARRLGASGPLLRDGDFEDDAGFSLFDWTRTDEAGFGAVRRPRTDDTGGNALYLINDQARSGEVARQLLLLAPGRYRLSLRVGDIAGDMAARPSVRLRCAAQGELALMDLRLPEANAAGRAVEGDLVVPAGGCPAQWLSVNVGAGSDEAQASTAWVDALALRRVG